MPTKRGLKGVEKTRQGQADGQTTLTRPMLKALKAVVADPGGDRAADETRLRSLANRGLVRIVYQITEEGDRQLAAGLRRSTSRTRTRTRTRTIAERRDDDAVATREILTPVSFHVGDVVDATRMGQTCRGTVAKFDLDEGLVGVYVYVFGDVVVQWYDSDQLALVRRG